MLARGKDLSKKLLHYHRIPVPAFAVFPMRRKVRRPTRLALPLIVKSLSEDASYGISQASVVDTDEKLAERVTFIHERIGTAAIAEQYIEGRELYVGVLGNDRLRVLPVWELEFGNMAQGAWPIATEKVKHDPRLSGAPRHPARAGQGPRSPKLRARIHERPSGSTARSSSTAMPASISACRPTASRIFSKPIPIPRSPRARSLPQPRCMTASRIRPPATHSGAGYETGNLGGVCELTVARDESHSNIRPTGGF